MQAIQSKYIPATNTKGSRIKATCERGSITVSYPDDLSGDACHVFAVDKLIEKFVAEDAKRYGSEINPWTKPRACGQLPDNSYAHVFISSRQSDPDILGALEIALATIQRLNPDCQFDSTKGTKDLLIAAISKAK